MWRPLAAANAGEAGGRREERGDVERNNGRAAERREQRRAGDRTGEPRGLPQRLEQGIAPGELVPCQK